jgi:hypothetical protein
MVKYTWYREEARACGSWMGLCPTHPDPPQMLSLCSPITGVPARDNRLLAQLARLFPGTLYFFP